MERKRLLVINAEIYTPEPLVGRGFILVNEEGIIEAIGEAGQQPEDTGAVVIDAKGRLILPGFIDVHVHGGNGFQVMDGTPESLKGMSLYHARHGTTSFLAGTDTDTEERLLRAVRNAALSLRNGLPGASLLGIHLEGPYIDLKRSGAMDKNKIRHPDLKELRRLIDASEDSIRLVTMAPELPGGLDMVEWLARRGITVSIGHSNATYEQVAEAVCRGAKHTTHHFNGMSPMHHREPGAAGAGLAIPDLTTEVIADGIHVHPAILKLLFDIKGTQGVCLITDAVQCAGLPDGDYGHVSMAGGKVMLKDGSSLAGSSLTMIQALKNMVAFTGYSLERILPSMTEVPARQIGVYDRKGSLTAGKDADFLIADSDLNILHTFVHGRDVLRK